MDGRTPASRQRCPNAIEVYLACLRQLADSAQDFAELVDIEGLGQVAGHLHGGSLLRHTAVSPSRGAEDAMRTL